MDHAFAKRALMLLLSVCLVVAIGCGKKLATVEGIVTLDGTPVDKATVVFVPEGPGQSASAGTDSSGKFSLMTSSKAGVMPGEYKVLVTKSTKESTSMKPGDPAYMKMMAEAAKPKTGGSTAVSGIESDNALPKKYAEAGTTPLKVKVPPESQPIKIELSSK